MSIAILKRQVIKDAEGNPIGVILPIEEYVLIEHGLPQQDNLDNLVEKINIMEQAIKDPDFMSDLDEIMTSFVTADEEWWEHEP
ncbi:MAG: hypothetical protein GX268_10540 [Methanomicrobiales archaeon]|jgi:hypothetical protein|nr:hypothetical protein [Methanomicrobiales archaeon]